MKSHWLGPGVWGVGEWEEGKLKAGSQWRTPYQSRKGSQHGEAANELAQVGQQALFRFAVQPAGL